MYKEIDTGHYYEDIKGETLDALAQVVKITINRGKDKGSYHISQSPKYPAMIAHTPNERAIMEAEYSPKQAFSEWVDNPRRILTNSHNHVVASDEDSLTLETRNTSAATFITTGPYSLWIIKTFGEDRFLDAIAGGPRDPTNINLWRTLLREAFGEESILWTKHGLFIPKSEYRQDTVKQLYKNIHDARQSEFFESGVLNNIQHLLDEKNFMPIVPGYSDGWKYHLPEGSCKTEDVSGNIHTIDSCSVIVHSNGTEVVIPYHIPLEHLDKIRHLDLERIEDGQYLKRMLCVLTAEDLKRVYDGDPLENALFIGPNGLYEDTLDITLFPLGGEIVKQLKV